MWGVFGSPVTEAIIKQKVSQYPSWYTASRQAHFRSLIGKGYFAFDCVNLIKAVLWGWCGDASKSYGGASYASNGVPDIDADTMIQRCKDVSTDFTKIFPGEAVWCPGHIGVYIGNGRVIECTPSWANGVQVTALSNHGSITGLNSRKWDKHGKLPYITYTNNDGEKKEVTGKVDYLVLVSPGVDERAAGYLGDFLKCPVANLKTVNKATIEAVSKKIYVVGTSEAVPDAKCQVENISGTNRYDTCRKVLDICQGKK